MLDTLSAPHDPAVDRHVGILTLAMGAVGQNDFWALISIYPSRYEEYERKVAKAESINLFDYGRIVEAGYGKQPPKEKLDDFSQRYGADYRLFETKEIDA